MNQQDLTVSEAQWGNNIKFTSDGQKNIQKLIEFQKLMLEFLRTGAEVKIANTNIAQLQQQIFKNRIENKMSYIQFFNENITGFASEATHQLEYIDDAQYSQLISTKWIQLKQFLFWMSFFFKCCLDQKINYQLDTDGFQTIKTKLFINNQIFIQKIICNLFEEERRNQHEQKNQHLFNLVQLFQVIGNKSIVLKKEFTNQQDPLVYSCPIPNDTSASQFYLDNCQKFIEEYLIRAYQQYQSEWSNLDTPTYVEKALMQLTKDQLLLERYFPLGVRKILDSIQQVIIVSAANQIVKSDKVGVMIMLKQQKYKELKQIYTLFKRVPWNDPKIQKDDKKDDKKKDDKKKDDKKEEKKDDKKKDDKMEEKKDDKKKEEKKDDKKKEEKKEEIKFYHPFMDLQEEIRQFILSKCAQINQSDQINNDPIKYIQGYIDLKQEIDNVLNNFMGKDSKLLEARDDGFKMAFNKFQQLYQFLAYFCDNFLNQDTNKDMSDDQIQQQIDIMLVFVQYITQRDSFFSLYEKYLCFRLLQSKISSEDQEKKVISQFKKDHGAQTIKKMEQMITDYYLQEDIQKDFLKYINEKQWPDITNQFSVRVLQLSCWPIDFEKQRQVLIPPQMMNLAQYFIQFYQDQHKQKSIDWAHTEGDGELIFTTAAKSKFQLVLSTVQMIILFQFNQQDELSFEKLKAQTGLSDQEIDREIKKFMRIALAGTKPKLEDAKQQLNNSHTIRINPNFQSKSKRINLNIKKSTATQSNVIKVDNQEVEQNRRIILDATIVRIMKSRRELDHQELIAQTCELIKLFKPDPKVIKQQIESLIERDYLLRNPKKPTQYIYKP